MKTVSKLFAVAAALVTFATTNLHAQSTEVAKGVRLAIGVSGGVADKGSPFEYGLGADLGFQFGLSREVALTATGGYTTMMAKDNGTDYNFIPVKGGIKVFPQIGGTYLLGEAGAGFATKDGGKTSVIWSAGLGYQFQGGFDIGARYEGYKQDAASTTYQPYNGQFALRLAYGFKL